MADLKIAVLLTKMVNSLHRLVGGHIIPESFQKTENDGSFKVDGAVLVRFENRGQTSVLIDDQILLLPGDSATPGEAFEEGDTAGPGIIHPYRIEFVLEPPGEKATPLPADAKPPYIFPGNYLDIRVLRRNLGPLA
jgi:hypothetical protein